MSCTLAARDRPRAVEEERAHQVFSTARLSTVTRQTRVEGIVVSRWVRACLVLFFVMGLGFGSWLSRLPSVRDELGASTIEMSIYGLCLAAGSLIGMLISGRFIMRLGPRRMMAVMIIVQVIALPAAVALMLAGLVPLGLVLLFLYGFSFSSTDIAMNVSGANAERLLGLPRLPYMHACYSIGSVSAMGIGAAAEALRVPLTLHFAVVAASIGFLGLLVLRSVPHDETSPLGEPSSSVLAQSGPVPVIESATGDELATTTGSIPVIAQAERGDDPPAGKAAHDSAGRRYNPWLDRRVLLIGLITLSAGLIEGAPADWLPLALVDGRGVSNEFGTVMLGIFFGAVVAARLAGSALLTRFGRVAVLRTSLVCAGIGVISVSLLPHPTVMVIGTILWGAGAGICWPITISAAADRRETAVQDVAAVSAIGYTSMLLGPMAFGVLGEQIGLLPAFLVLPIFVVLATIIAGITKPVDR